MVGEETLWDKMRIYGLSVARTAVLYNNDTTQSHDNNLYHYLDTPYRSGMTFSSGFGFFCLNLGFKYLHRCRNACITVKLNFEFELHHALHHVIPF